MNKCFGCGNDKGNKSAELHTPNDKILYFCNECFIHLYNYAKLYLKENYND